MDYSLIANSGIQMLTFPITINTQEKFRMWFHEWYDDANNCWRLDHVYELQSDGGCYYYNKKELYDAGYLAAGQGEFAPAELKGDKIYPLRIDNDMCDNVSGEVFSFSISEKNSNLSSFENVWLPIPYFYKPTEKKFSFGPLNWSRMKLIPNDEGKDGKKYDVLLAFDTHTQNAPNEYDECPIFDDKVTTEKDYSMCDNEFYLMDYSTPGKSSSHINDYLFRLVHPDLQRISQIKGNNIRRLGYIATYVLLVKYLSDKRMFPNVTLYRDTEVEVKDVDMVVDIGNSRTTALLIEDNTTFNQIRPLTLTDYTNPICHTDESSIIRSYSEPFDMRLAFRKVSFGDIGIKDSKQFVYPSFVRLGHEAQELIRSSASNLSDDATLSTYSSPKRYLWDGKPNKEEWKFLVLDGEKDDHILDLCGITNNLKSDGCVDHTGNGGTSHHYSRRSLMTFAFLEMLVQARTQINCYHHRSNTTGFGKPSMARKIKRVIVTCPTAMSKVEREALVQCAKDATILLECFDKGISPDALGHGIIDVIPAVPSRRDNDTSWYYDEATCSQLVYMYGEVGYKYKGCCGEFFNLYGKVVDNDDQPSITVGSLDIGAGTSDLMINRYTYDQGDITTITPDPLFYDSYYYAGDDMLYALIKNIMLFDPSSAFRKALALKSNHEYRQLMRNFFGKDYAGQSVADRVLRRDFNIQYSIPLMYHYLSLLSGGVKQKTISYYDVFATYPPNPRVLTGFNKCTGIDVSSIEWLFDSERVSDIVSREFEPLLRKLATIMYSYSCDIVLLSGRPASLPAIRNLFLKYYSVSPNRLIVLNNFYVGDWYPFSENTGYIRNAKTIVAMGGLIAHYASELSNLNKFVIKLDKLKDHLKSTVNYIESSRVGLPIEYFLTPEKHQGEITVSSLPATLNVRQIALDTYPCRTLYSIDYNRQAMSDRIRRKSIGKEPPTNSNLQSQVKNIVDGLKRRAPFTISIDQDNDNKEKLTITSIIDKDGSEVNIEDIEINIQSLGVDGQYWLDTGAFDF